ncbi:MAG: hypothetical protein GY940_34940 [bacterium]|nr:hypothetical protein [bacterium]
MKLKSGACLILIPIALGSMLLCNIHLDGEKPNTANTGNQNNNKKYAGVFKPLDGKWKGTFYVYSHPRGQAKTTPQPGNIDAGTIKRMAGKVELVIDVEQVYKSESPYLQTVRITDTYTEPDGGKRVEVSTGVNKVEKGELVCIVNKPGEQVIHKGNSEGKNTIVWRRHLEKPLKVEFFKETVEKNQYTIVGWGYYGNDDLTLGPKTWFYAIYVRQ